jgi:Cd2+/Zn2+-exporting ATPase
MLAGERITARVDGHLVHVGNKQMFQRLGLYSGLGAEDEAVVDAWAALGGTTGFVALKGDGIVGCYSMMDKIRDEAPAVVRDLWALGVNLVMLTGDQRPAALKIGRQLSLDDGAVRSGLLPVAKLAAIGGLVGTRVVGRRPWGARWTVLMCANGVNDAPALAWADMLVTMGEGAALTMETSDMTPMDSNLEKLVLAVTMGRCVLRTILENVTFALMVKALVLWYTLAGRSSLWAAIASDVGAMLAVTLNDMKLPPRSSQKVEVAAREEV